MTFFEIMALEQLLGTADYGPYGERFDIWWKTDADEESYDRFGFGTEYRDETGLIYYGARYYNPSLGRFISRDPAGEAGSGVNLYAFCSGDPVNRRELYGLCDYGFWGSVESFFSGIGDVISGAISYVGDAIGGAWSYITSDQAAAPDSNTNSSGGMNSGASGSSGSSSASGSNGPNQYDEGTPLNDEEARNRDEGRTWVDTEDIVHLPALEVRAGDSDGSGFSDLKYVVYSYDSNSGTYIQLDYLSGAWISPMLDKWKRGHVRSVLLQYREDYAKRVVAHEEAKNKLTDNSTIKDMKDAVNGELPGTYGKVGSRNSLDTSTGKVSIASYTPASEFSRDINGFMAYHMGTVHEPVHQSDLAAILPGSEQAKSGLFGAGSEVRAYTVNIMVIDAALSYINLWN